MAYFYDNGKAGRQMQFIVDTVADISKLPTMTVEGDRAAASGLAYQRVAAGSIALCIASGDLYVLNTYDKWTKVGG